MNRPDEGEPLEDPTQVEAILAPMRVARLAREQYLMLDPEGQRVNIALRAMHRMTQDRGETERARLLSSDDEQWVIDLFHQNPEFQERMEKLTDENLSEDDRTRAYQDLINLRTRYFNDFSSNQTPKDL